MKIALQIFSWIAVVLGALAILGAMDMANYGDTYGAVTSLIGGGLFITLGVLALVYINLKEG